MFISWIRKIFQRPTKPIRRLGSSAKPAKKWSFQPGVEALEDRAVPAFLAPVNFAAGVAPTAIATGDFNGDGRQDIVTVNSGYAGLVSTLLGNGDGTFQSAVSSAAGAYPTQLGVADFNGDGKLDVVVGGSSTLNVLLGNGDGSFQAPALYYVGGVATHISVGDFNNDGHPDLVMSTQIYGGTAMVLMNTGAGAFAPQINLAAGAGAMDVEVGDFNHDGNQDLVIANYNSINVSLGNGNGTFQSARPYAAGLSPYRVALGDFNHDGTTDIVALDAYALNLIGSSAMSMLSGKGDGSFSAPTTYTLGSQASDMQTADFNGDGNLDLIEPTASGYQAEMGVGDGSFYVPENYAASAGINNAVADFNGDGVTDVAASSPTGNVVVLINGTNAVTNLAGATGLQISVPSSVVAGTPFALTVTAVDAAGNTVSGFTGSVAIPNGSPAAAQMLSYTFTAADAGTHTFTNATLYAAGTDTVTVTTPFLPAASQSVAVAPAAATHFAVAAPATAGAGASLSFTVTALDAYGNTATGYAGTVGFSSGDGQAVLPAGYTFTAADAGIQILTATLKTAGAQVITTSDATGIVSNSAAIAVAPSAATSLSLSGGGGFIGSAHTVTITARDAFGNVEVNYYGTAHLTSSDSTTVVSADASLVNGVGTFTVTPMTLGVQTLTATDTATSLVMGTEAITVTPGWAARFVMSPLSATTAGNSQSVTVTAFDAFGNVSNVYTGAVLVSTTDARVGSFYATFSAADAGVHTISIPLMTAGSQSVSVTDVANPSVTVSQSGITVTAGAAASISVTALHGTTAGVAQTFTVTARDAFGNIATGYTGTLAFSSSDTQATLPASYTFAAADAGVHTFSMAFKTSGGQSITVQDSANVANSAFTFFQRDILINAATMTGFAFRAPTNVTAGVAFNLTVMAVDAYGNVVTGYTGKVHFSGPSGIPLDYTFTAADAGAHTFSVTLTSTGTQTIGVQDTVTGALKGQVQVTVKTASTSGSGGTTSGGGGTGGGGKKIVV